MKYINVIDKTKNSQTDPSDLFACDQVVNRH